MFAPSPAAGKIPARTAGEVTGQYSGAAATYHGPTGIAATYVVDADGTVSYERVADHPGDRIYGNFVRNGFSDPFDGA